MLSVQFSSSVVPDSLQPHELQHVRPPCPSPTPGVHPNLCPLSWWCHPTISSSVIPFSSHLYPASGSFPVSQFFASGGHSIGASALASVFPMNTQDGFALGLTGWISLQSKGLSRIFFIFSPYPQSNPIKYGFPSFIAELHFQFVVPKVELKFELVTVACV